MPKKDLAPLLIHNWKELSEVEDSETHQLEIEDHCGWIRSKSNDDIEYYLSTHTFYDSTFQSSSKILQAHGFNVQLKSLDA